MTTNTPLSEDKIALLEDVARQAALSDQNSDRQRLRDAMPSLVGVFDEDDDSIKFKRHSDDHRLVENRERWLSVIWPKDQTIAQIEEEYVHETFEDIKLFDFESDRFERIPTVNMNMVEFFIRQRYIEIELDDPYEVDGVMERYESTTTSDHILMILSPRVIVEVNAQFGEPTDEDFNASSTGSVYVSENKRQMLLFSRQKLTEFSAESAKEKDIEVELERIFKKNYEPPAMEKGIRP